MVRSYAPSPDPDLPAEVASELECALAMRMHAELILGVAKAVGSHLDYGDVLDAISASLAPCIRYDSIAVVVLEGEFVRLHSLHIADLARLPGESVSSLVTRSESRRVASGEIPRLLVRTRIQDSCLSRVVATGEPYVITDLERQRCFPEDEDILQYGIRAYVCIPLRKQTQLFGGIFFTVNEKREFSEYEIRLLRDMSDIMSIAVSNSLAYEQIRSLQERLQEENQLLQDEIEQRSMYEEIVGSSPELLRVLAAVDKVGPTDSTVLITGETGTGKELLARAIHRRSPRAARSLVKLNCAAMPSELIASELFGHEKGAFTGALQQRIGRFETADGGTIFLDEIGELTPEMQVALLRVLQEREFERVGSNVTRRTDVRVIAATNRDLAAEVAAGRFRSDLYYRLNVFPLHSPPLRDRRDDIPVLVDYFVARFANRMGKQIREIDRQTRASLTRYAWPGNIRELQNVIERAVILTEGPVLRMDTGTLAPAPLPAAEPPPAPARHATPREEIEELLRQTRGRISGPHGAATRLGVPASTLESRLRALGINKHLYRAG